jgi:hypothetical protein
MKDMNVEDMLRELVDHGLVCIPAHHVLNDLIGGHESQPPKVAAPTDNVSAMRQAIVYREVHLMHYVTTGEMDSS